MMRTTPTAPVRTGLEAFLDEGLPRLHGRRAGLLTNQTGVDRRFRSTIDLLHADGCVDLRAVFAPEHGVRGEAQAGVTVPASVDERTGLPIHSLYGDTHQPTAAMLAGLDALVFDLQDVGVRYATYISTMAGAQEAAAGARLDFVVFDRPNPINGAGVEGGVLEPAFRSYVGAHPLPVRHGLTAGELARLVAAERGWPEPAVVPMCGWRRPLWFDQTGLPWVQPSPNLPTLDTITLYPGTCLIEGTNPSEGRGTTRPFELLGAPWLDPYPLVLELERRALPGVAFRPAFFTPAFSKHAGARCGGLQVHITDRERLSPVSLGIHLLHAVRTTNRDAFAWRESADGGFFIDRLLGSDRPRRALEGGAGVDEVTAPWADEVSAFVERRRPFLLYAESE